MNTFIRRWFFPPRFDDPDEQRAATILHGLSLLATFASAGILIYWAFTEYLELVDIVIYTSASIVSFFIYTLLHRRHLRLASWLVVILSWMLVTVVSIFRGGLLSPVWNYYITIVFIAGIVINTRTGMILSVLSGIVSFLYIPLQNNNYIRFVVLPPNTTLQVLIANLLVVTALMAFTLNDIQRNIKRSRKAEEGIRERNQELESLRTSLEERVIERTRAVEKRTTQLVASAEVARAASAELNPSDMLNRTVYLIRERFDLYYAGAFTISSDNKYAVLVAGTGEPGQRMLENHHRLEIGGQSMIGKAISLQEARIALDVGDEAVRFNNPLLPRTRSEMALPLVARERALGALTIQSDQPEAFSTEDIVSLQGMADLIAVALDNARLFQEAQIALAEVSTLHRSYISNAWTTFAQKHSTGDQAVPTYIFDGKEVRQGDAANLPNLIEAIATHKPSASHDQNNSTLTVPLHIRDQVIGALAFETDTADRIWSEDELTLIEAIAEQAALALENARLIEETEESLTETRLLVNRERTINEISEKIRRLPSVDTILTTALLELGKTLGANKGAVRISSANIPTEEMPKI